MAFCLKIKFVCQRSECASTLDPQASLLPVLSIITLNHLKSGCRDFKKRGDVYGDKGEWVRIRPSGDGPTQQYGRHAEVINDKMYIMQAPLRDSGGPTTIYLYALDLNNWQWTKNVPEGLLPLSDTKEFSSWHHRGKIYYFGGQCGYDDGIVSGD